MIHTHRVHTGENKSAVNCDKQEIENKKKLSTSSFRLRASSVSSSRSSDTLGSPFSFSTSSQATIETEKFWNQYRRHQADGFMKHVMG